MFPELECHGGLVECEHAQRSVSCSRIGCRAVEHGHRSCMSPGRPCVTCRLMAVLLLNAGRQVRSSYHYSAMVWFCTAFVISSVVKDWSCSPAFGSRVSHTTAGGAAF
jgi:hypothetical protein